MILLLLRMCSALSAIIIIQIYMQTVTMDRSGHYIYIHTYVSTEYSILICIKTQSLRLKEDIWGKYTQDARYSRQKTKDPGRRERAQEILRYREACTCQRRISVIIIPHSRRTFHSHRCNTLAPQIAIKKRSATATATKAVANPIINLAQRHTFRLSFFISFLFLRSLYGALLGARNIAAN